MGTQYRSAIYFTKENNLKTIFASKEQYQKELNKNLGLIETEIKRLIHIFMQNNTINNILHQLEAGSIVLLLLQKFN